MSATSFRNCSPLCAEHLGGNCLGEGCPYAYDAKDSLPLGEPYDEWLNDWAPVDHRVFETAQYRAGRFVGFCIGVVSVLVGMGVLWFVDWILREVIS